MCGMKATCDAAGPRPGLPPDLPAEGFRRVLGHFCTGVSVITAADDEGPVGFACQAFSALSADPPLVLFCPARSLGCWPRIARAGYFCVNVLSAGQDGVARAFGTRGADKFAAVGWSLSPGGGPVLDGVLTWAGCSVLAVHEAGDHYIVTGRVAELGECRAREPLLYYRGRLGHRPALITLPGPASPLEETR
jgi:3-hydroxy-9,10-secoandrosta-1,3,5(10)-triene-9,17-dione monooxygenase reductase component